MVRSMTQKGSPSFAMDSQQVIELRHSIKDCSDRGLSVASKWFVLQFHVRTCTLSLLFIIRSSELLLSIPLAKRNPAHVSTFSTSTPARSRSPRPSLSFVNTPPAPLAIPVTPSPHLPQAQFEPEDVRRQELEWEAQDEDVLAAARACVGAREFLRAVHLLHERKSAKAQFLSLYSQFMVR